MALSFLGLSLVIDNSTQSNCDDVLEGYTYQEPELNKTIICVTVEEGYTYTPNECIIDVMRLKLVRNIDLVTPAPMGMCEAQLCEQGDLLVCAPIGNKPMVKITANIEGCKTQNSNVFDPAKSAAACLIKRFWAVNQPMELN
jgi:hypothetical protein